MVYTKVMPCWGLGGLLPLAMGLIWLGVLFDHGIWAWLTGAVPALMFTICGGAWLLSPGDKRYLQLLSLAAVVAVVGALLGLLSWGWLWSLLFLGFALAAAVVSGWITLVIQPEAEDVPAVEISPKLALKTALDNVLLAFFILLPDLIRSSDKLAKTAQELDDALAVMEEKGWDKNIDALIPPPPPLTDPHIRQASLKGHQLELMRYDSLYQPVPELPGSERWNQRAANKTARAMLFRHDDDAERPWIIGIHGYQMGTGLFDLTLFDPDFYHKKMGCNLVLPLLPLHGARKQGRISGNGYLNGDTLDSFNAARQSLWDLRRLLTWVRAQNPSKIMVLGFSLGGYNTALLTSVEAVDVAIASIPLTDIPNIMLTHSPTSLEKPLFEHGITPERCQALMRAVSPLSRASCVVPENRHIIAGLGDEIIPPNHVLPLINHWQDEQPTWFHGSHLVFQDQVSVRNKLRDVIENQLKT